MNNSEILFIYSAKLCNPNGDPDNENRPRIDYKTGRNIVTDVRLKRFFRDYIMRNFGEKYVWVSLVNGEHKRAEERGENLKEVWGLGENWYDHVTKYCIDARLFGATIPLAGKKGKSEEGEKSAGGGKGDSISIIGPVQFAWGFSLHPVDEIEFPSITSIFSTDKAGKEGEGGRAYGTIGKDYRIYFSLLAFYGVVSGKRGEVTGLRDDDVKILDNLLWDSVVSEASTRSKVGEYPELYVRVEYKEPTFLGDLRDYLDVEFKGAVREIEDLTVSCDRLVSLLEENAEKIANIYVRESGRIVWKDGKSLSEALKSFGNLKSKVQNLPHDLKITGDELILAK